MLPFDGWLFNRLTIYNLGINNIVVIAGRGALACTITVTNCLHSVALPIVGKRSINSRKCRYIVSLSSATHSGPQHICKALLQLLLSFLQLCAANAMNMPIVVVVVLSTTASIDNQAKDRHPFKYYPIQVEFGQLLRGCLRVLPLHSASQKRLNQ